ncbi:ComF family protein [Novosphingobium piscinae]|uniref:ComF family protein n=1 Tax=Novosphingobium piscinae TaxID=1507448 RepID=A0A7X1FYR3_9SPHN|nr:ComF family protein [Novosphingobium piscinae]MBC2669423.1 ComF family protein [Novosphingobium piscinae]
MPVPDWVAPLVDFVFPPRCPLCGTGVASHGALCAGCWSSLVMPAVPACRTCGRPFARPVAADALCAPCLARPPRHDGLVAATLYTDASRRLVIAFKRGGRMALAGLLGRMLWARLQAAPLEPVGPGWLIVPVPIHRWRLWTRGFNQSALLGREIARHTGGRLLVDALIRTRSTPTLGGLGRKARQRVLRGAITVRPGARAALAGARVLLVDDVVTSGATVDACVRALRRGGAASVTVACFARVLDEALPQDAVGQGSGLVPG